MSGTQPFTTPNPPKVINTCMQLWCEGDVGCTRCCGMSAALVLAPSSYIQGCVRCAYQLSELPHAPRPCLNINPLKQSKWWSRVRGGSVVHSGCRGNWSCCVVPWQATLLVCEGNIFGVYAWMRMAFCNLPCLKLWRP
jgi:hypothetical protein